VPKVTPKLAQRIHDFFHQEGEGGGASPAASVSAAPAGPSLASDGKVC
jgi:hypothetical protein